MTDLLARGSAWLEQQRTYYLAHPVTYSRGTLQVTLSATRGRSAYRTDDGHVIQIQYTDADFLLLVDQLRMNDELIEPERGDRITDGETVYEVLQWQFSDLYRQTYRITTQEIGASP